MHVKERVASPHNLPLDGSRPAVCLAQITKVPNQPRRTSHHKRWRWYLSRLRSFFYFPTFFSRVVFRAREIRLEQQAIRIDHFGLYNSTSLNIMVPPPCSSNPPHIPISPACCLADGPFHVASHLKPQAPNLCRVSVSSRVLL